MKRSIIPLLLLLGACKDKGGGGDDTDDTGTGGTDSGTSVYEDLDEDGFTSDIDCDDANPAINPAAAELCDEVDNDCDNAVDEGVTGAYYLDDDGDGFGDPSRIVEACELVAGLSENPDDCDDTRFTINPDATEYCNDVDDDCDELVDENDAADAVTWYLDEDGDLWGDTEKITVACDQPDLYVATDGDCDDEVDTVYPGALETCNDVDDDCDLDIDEDAVDASTWYRDRDADGYGVDGDFVVQCDGPSGYAELGGDCDDYVDEINPAAEEICDAVDNDCDATTTESGLVTFESVDGILSDVSDYFSDGTYSRPSGWSLSADGTFYFCQGTYYTYLDLEADINLVGVHGATETILSAGDLVSVVELDTDGVDASITGLTLRDGQGSGAFFGSPAYNTGGAVYCASNSVLVVEDSVLTESAAEVGGGLYVEDCEVTIRSSEISDCAADYGGGVAVAEGDAILSEVTVSGNDASYSGGGAYVDGSGDVAAGMSVAYSLFEGNDAVYGGAVAVFEGGLGCTGSSKTVAGFLDNSASYGGAAFISAPDSFRSNTCDWGEGTEDNTPEDIFIDPLMETYDFGDDATFTCSSYACNE